MLLTKSLSSLWGIGANIWVVKQWKAFDEILIPRNEHNKTISGIELTALHVLWFGLDKILSFFPSNLNTMLSSVLIIISSYTLHVYKSQLLR